MHFPLILLISVFLFIQLTGKKYSSLVAILALLLGLFFVVPAQAATLYVSQSTIGNDDACGAGATFRNKHLQEAIDCAVAQAGADTIVIAGCDQTDGILTNESSCIYSGAYGVSWNKTGDNALVILQGAQPDLTVNAPSVVNYLGTSYRCIRTHTSSAGRAPGNAKFWVAIASDTYPAWDVGHVGNYVAERNASNWGLDHDIWWNKVFPTILRNNQGAFYEGVPIGANISVGFYVTGSNQIYGVPVSIANMQLEGKNVGIFLKGDSDRPIDSIHLAPAPTTVVNTRIHGYGSGGYGSGPYTGHGIAIFGGSKAVIINNEVASNYDGITISDPGTSPVILGNYIFYNKRVGIGARNDSSPLIGYHESGRGRVAGERNEIFANYIGIGCRDGSTATIANNLIYGKMSKEVSGDKSWKREYADETCRTDCSDNWQQERYNSLNDCRGDCNVRPPYSKLGIAVRDSSAPYIYGNKVMYNAWGGIINTDFSKPTIGHLAAVWDDIRYSNSSDSWSNMNFIYYNSGAFANDSATCNNRAPLDGRSAIGTKDASEAVIVGNEVYDNNWTGIGARNWSRTDIYYNIVEGNDNVGIAVSNARSSDGATTNIYSNRVTVNSNAGIAVRDSGNALYRVRISNNIVKGINNRRSSGIGLNHSYASIFNNTIYRCGNNLGGTYYQMSAGVGVRNGSDVIINDNRIFENGLGIVIAGSRAIVENNLITDNMGTTLPIGIWVSDLSTAVRINHNVIIGNDFSENLNKYKGHGILVKNNSELQEAKYNIFHNYEYAIETVGTGVVKQGVVDHNLFTVETDSGDHTTFNNANLEEAAYILYYWDEDKGDYVQDYPGPNTHYFGARFDHDLDAGTVPVPHFNNPGTSGNAQKRDLAIRTDSPVYKFTSAQPGYTDYIGLSSDFPYVLDFSDLPSFLFQRLVAVNFPSVFNNDAAGPVQLDGDNVQIVKTVPEPNSENAFEETDIVLYLRDTGDGIAKSSIVAGLSVSDAGGSVSGNISYEPSHVNTSSWYKVKFVPDVAFQGGVVSVSWSADDALGNTDSSIYTFRVMDLDDYAPFLTSLEPANLYTNVNKNPFISFHLNDTDSNGYLAGGIDQSSIGITIEGTATNNMGVEPMAEVVKILTAAEVADAISNTDLTNIIITYIPTMTFEYDSAVTVYVTADDFSGRSLNDSFQFTIQNDNVPPEDAQAFRATPRGTNGVYLTWVPSVNSEKDLSDQIVYYCNNWDTGTESFNCYGKGTENYNWRSDFNGSNLGVESDSTLVADLSSARYTFMLEAQDERGDNTLPSRMEDFESANDIPGYVPGDWHYAQALGFMPESGTFKVVSLANNNVLRGEGSITGSGDDDALVAIDYYYPGNFYYKFKFTLETLTHGAYALLRHNIGEQNNLGGKLGTSGYVAFVDPTAGASKIGFKILPDPVALEEGCDFCDSTSDLAITEINDLEPGKEYEVHITAYGEELRMVLLDEFDSDRNDAVAYVTATRYRVGELGFYEPAGDCAGAGHTDYDDVEIEWYGVFVEDPVYVRSGYFNDDFNGFADDFEGSLDEWTVSGQASWSTASGMLESSGYNGELVAFGFTPQKYFKTSVAVTIDTASNANKAHVLFRRQYLNGVGSTGYIAAIEENLVGSEIGFYKLTSAGLQRLNPGSWETDVIEDGVYTMEVSVEEGALTMKVIQGGSTVTNSVTDVTYSGGMVGIYRGGDVSGVVKYDDFSLNDKVENDWTLSDADTWEVNMKKPFKLEHTTGSGIDNEVLVKDLILADSFMFEADMTISGALTTGAAFYFQKQVGATKGNESYGLFLKIDTNTDDSAHNVYFFKRGDSSGNETVLENQGDFYIASGQETHVKIMASDAGFPDVSGTTGNVRYGFAAYLSTTEDKPYKYHFIAAAQVTGEVVLDIEGEITSTDLYLDGQAGFIRPEFSAATFVNVDNVVIGQMQGFGISREGAGGERVTIFNGNENPGAFTNDEIYSMLQSTIYSINENAGSGTLCNTKYIELGPYTYDIKGHALSMGNCVSLRGSGIYSTTIQGSSHSIVYFPRFEAQNSSLEDLTLDANEASGNEACVWIIDNSPLIMNVRAKECATGIRVGGGRHDPVNFPAQPTITASIIVSNSYIGIGNNVDSRAWIINNWIYGNDYNGIGVLSGATPRIENNIIGSSGTGGLWVLGNGNMGIGVNDESSPIIIGNTILYNNKGGIGMRSTATPDIFNNTIVSNDTGIMAEGHANPLVYNNIMRNNSTYGCSAQGSVIWELKYNEMSENQSGIKMKDDSTGLIVGNYIHSNDGVDVSDAGISARGGADTTIFNNWVVDNYYKGMAFLQSQDSDYVLIRYNYIARNAVRSDTTGNNGISVVGDTANNNLNYGHFIIENNVIRDNNDGAVGFKNFGGSLLFQGNLVYSNIYKHTDGASGIGFRTPSLTNIVINENTFWNNTNTNASEAQHTGVIGLTGGNLVSMTVTNNLIDWPLVSMQGSQSAISAIGTNFSSNTLEISGNTIKHAEYGIELTESSGVVSVVNNDIYSCAGGVRIKNHSSINNGIIVLNNGNSIANGIQFKTNSASIHIVGNNTFNNSNGATAVIYGQDNTGGITILNNLIVADNTTERGIGIKGDGHISISNNTVTNVLLIGIGLSEFGGYSPYGTIKNNVVYSNNPQSSPFGGMWFSGGIGGTILYNSEVNSNRSLWILGNTVFNNTGGHAGGIGFSAANAYTDITVRNNVVYWNHSLATNYSPAGIGYLDGEGDIVISDNIVYSNSSAASSTGIGVRWHPGRTGVAGRISIMNNLVYNHNVENVSTGDDEGKAGMAGIAIRNVTLLNGKDLIIENNTVRNNTVGIRIRGEDPYADSQAYFSISNNTVLNNVTNGIIVQGYGRYMNVSIESNTLDNSEVSNNGRSGIRVREVDGDVTVKDNAVGHFGSCGIRMRTIKNIAKIEGNTVSHINCSGISAMSIMGGASLSISNNLLYSNTDINTLVGVVPMNGGISINTIGNNTSTWIYSNVIRNNSSAVAIGGIGIYSHIYSATASGIKITFNNNTVRSSTGFKGGGVGFINIHADVLMMGNSIYNNESTSTTLGVGGIGFMDSGGSVIIDNNVIYSNTTAATQAGQQ